MGKLNRLVLLFTILSNFFGLLYSNEVMIPEANQIAHQIIDETNKIIKQKYNLEPCGTGFNGKFEYIEISFDYFDYLSKDKARTMLFDCANIFLEKINSNKKIKLHLKQYPFKYENVGIVIYISKPNFAEIYYPDICVARKSSYGIVFKSLDPENTFQYKEIQRETHKEALAILKQQQQNIADQKSN